MKHVFRIMLLGLVVTTASCEDKKEDKEETTDKDKIEQQDNILETDSTENPIDDPHDDNIPIDSAAVDSL